MNSSFVKRLIGLSLVMDLVILDQISKWLMLEVFLRPLAEPATEGAGIIDWIAEAPDRLAPAKIEVAPFFNIVMVWNQGISFGLFQAGSVAAMWAMVAVALAITIFFGVWLARADRWLPAIAAGMVIGGALGNIVDRLRFGAVADFLDFHAFGWHWPAFNVADAGITCGVALLILDGLCCARPMQKESVKT